MWKKFRPDLRASIKDVRTWRKITQGVGLVLFLWLAVASTFLNPRGELSSLFYRLDPLAGLAAMLAGRVMIAGLALAGVTILVTLVLGRVWCGWLCPMGTTLDLVKPHRAPRNPPPDRLRVVKYLLLALIVAGALFGSLSWMIFDPITLMTRTFTGAVWPALRYSVYALEGVLYQFDFLWGPLDAVHQVVVYPLFRDTLAVFWLAIPTMLVFAGIVALNWKAERFWCRYLCPLGGMLGLLSRFSLFRRVVNTSCTGCGLCSNHCPTGTIDHKKDFASDPAECTVCYECVSRCSRAGTTFRWHLPGKREAQPAWRPAAGQPYDINRRAILGALGAGAVWSALSGVEPIRKRQPARLIRPPGATLTDFDSLCIRCNECVRVCATQGLQPTFLESGWQNMLTPRLEPRMGYCSYTCNACGQVCPSGAIPALTVEEKRLVPIGLAQVNRNRCLPWAYNVDCIVCEETCPVGDKAIKLEVAQIVNEQGETVTIQRPHVVKELCIGCGMCEYQCPMGGESGILVYAPTEAGVRLGEGASG